MPTDERLIEIMARRAEEECGFSKLSTVLSHYSWLDVFTHLYFEKGLAVHLIKAYEPDIVNALAKEKMEADSKQSDDAESYAEWRADVQTRGGS